MLLISPFSNRSMSHPPSQHQLNATIIWPLFLPSTSLPCPGSLFAIFWIIFSTLSQREFSVRCAGLSGRRARAPICCDRPHNTQQQMSFSNVDSLKPSPNPNCFGNFKGMLELIGIYSNDVTVLNANFRKWALKYHPDKGIFILQTHKPSLSNI